MKVLDVIALALVLGSAVAFAVGASALSRSEDVAAIYWLVVGTVAVRGAIQISRPRGT